MGLDPSFTEAFIHRPHAVFGRSLRPYCLWHRLLLRSIDSPLLRSDARITARDLDQAVSICRCRYRQADFRARHPARLLWRIAAGGLARETRAFFDYMADYLGKPEYDVVLTKAQMESAPPAPRGRPPEELSTAAAIVGWARCPLAQAWEMPIGEASWYAAMAQEAAGAQLDFETEEDRQFLADLEDKNKEKGEDDGCGQ